MSKINKLFKAIGLILKQPALLNKVLDDEDVNKQEVIRQFNLPEGLKAVDIIELLPGFNETVSPYSMLDGGSTPFDLALLKGLAKKIKECQYFEIGTWRGESVANVAEVATQCYTLNLPDADMLQMGLDKAYVDQHRYYSNDLKNVIHLQANSKTFDFSSIHKKFDLIFIDGDHHYETVKSDTENAFNLLKDENSMIVWHDYGNNPNDVRWDVLRGILEGAPSDKRNMIYRVTNTLCAIYTNADLKSFRQVKFHNPDKHFSVSVKSVSK